jgi:hypothetical protein
MSRERSILHTSICLCCFESLPAASEIVTENPNVCPACARLIAELYEGADAKKSITEATPPGSETVAPISASMFGGTFVWTGRD